MQILCHFTQHQADFVIHPRGSCSCRESKVTEHSTRRQLYIIYIHMYVYIVCAYYIYCSVAQLCPTLCDPVDCSMYVKNYILVSTSQCKNYIRKSQGLSFYLSCFLFCPFFFFFFQVRAIEAVSQYFKDFYLGTLFCFCWTFALTQQVLLLTLIIVCY